MASLATVENRKANRKLAKVYLLNRASARVAAPPPPELKPIASELTALELEKIQGQLAGYDHSGKQLPPSLVCTDAWAATITEKLQELKPNGKRVVPYAITHDGRLKTKFPRLVEQVAEAGIYPPPADDVEYCDVRRGTHHIGSTMAPCWCRDCAGKRLWPVHYLRDNWIAECCLANRRPLADGAEPIVQDAARVTSEDLSGRIVYDADAWRADGINRLWTDDERPKEIVAKLRKHRWSFVTGNKRAKLVKAGLASVGAVADFIALGHSLAGVIGVDWAFDVARRVDEYPKVPRRAGAKFIWQRTTLGRR